MEDKEFQGLLLSKVEDGWKQIKLKGTQTPTADRVQELFPLNATKFKVHRNISHLENLSIDDARELEDVSYGFNPQKLFTVIRFLNFSW